MSDEPNLAICKHDELPTPLAPEDTDKCAASDGFKCVEVDDAIIKDDEFQSLMASLDELDCVLDEELEFESLLALLAPVENDKCGSDDFKFDGIMGHIVNCANRYKSAMEELLKDLYEIVSIGLMRGDFRKDQLGATASGGVQRLVELAYWYKIPLRSAPGERIRLQSDTLTFVRAIACFPHIASLLLCKRSEIAMNGAKSVLASEQLPDAMKHSGFPGLIPLCCGPFLMKAYLFAHTAYMVDFGKLINPGDKRSLKAIALNQLDYSKAGFGKLPYGDEFRVGILRAVGLADPCAFKKVVDVCNNLCKVIDEPEITFATAKKYHIKNNMICFFEDDTKDVAAGERTKDFVDKLKVASIYD